MTVRVKIVHGFASSSRDVKAFLVEEDGNCVRIEI
jgi:hypothetical protein